MPSDNSFNEKRDFVRLRIDSAVTLDDSGTQYQGICKDLSGKGMLIHTQQEFSVGTHLGISIMPEDEKHMPYSANGKVSRTEAAEGGGFIVGLSIDQIND